MTSNIWTAVVVLLTAGVILVLSSATALRGEALERTLVTYNCTSSFGQDSCSPFVRPEKTALPDGQEVECKISGHEVICTFL